MVKRKKPKSRKPCLILYTINIHQISFFLSLELKELTPFKDRTSQIVSKFIDRVIKLSICVSHTICTCQFSHVCVCNVKCFSQPSMFVGHTPTPPKSHKMNNVHVHVMLNARIAWPLTLTIQISLTCWL